MSRVVSWGRTSLFPTPMVQVFFNTILPWDVVRLPVQRRQLHYRDIPPSQGLMFLQVMRPMRASSARPFLLISHSKSLNPLPHYSPLSCANTYNFYCCHYDYFNVVLTVTAFTQFFHPTTMCTYPNPQYISVGKSICT